MRGTANTQSPSGESTGNNLGSRVTITQGVTYTATEDGYAEVGCANNTSSYGQIQIKGPNGGNQISVYINGSSLKYSSIPVFVRKGMKITNYDGAGSYWVYYYPFTV